MRRVHPSSNMEQFVEEMMSLVGPEPVTISDIEDGLRGSYLRCSLAMKIPRYANHQISFDPEIQKTLPELVVWITPRGLVERLRERNLFVRYRRSGAGIAVYVSTKYFDKVRYQGDTFLPVYPM